MSRFESEAAKKFLSEYLAYEMRLASSEAKIGMRQCIGPSDLRTLLACSRNLVGVEVLRKLPEGAAAANVRVEIQTPVAPFRLADALAEEAVDEEGDEEDESSTIPEAVVRNRVRNEQVLYLSNAHIEIMLVHALGPMRVMESSEPKEIAVTSTSAPVEAAIEFDSPKQLINGAAELCNATYVSPENAMLTPDCEFGRHFTVDFCAVMSIVNLFLSSLRGYFSFAKMDPEWIFLFCFLSFVATLHILGAKNVVVDGFLGLSNEIFLSDFGTAREARELLGLQGVDLLESATEKRT
jgi:hypothetical protein